MAVLGGARGYLVRKRRPGYQIDDPIGIEGLAYVDDLPIFGALGGYHLVGVVASVVVRFCRSRGVEREQMKWSAYAVVPMLVIPPGDYLRGIIGRVASTGVLIAQRSGVHAETTQEHGDIQHRSAGDRCALDLPTR